MNQKFKGKVLSQRSIVNSILKFYSLASISENKDGLEWYKVANDYCKELAQRFGITLSQAAGIIAAFSPQTGWTENKRYAVTFLTYPHRQVKSACQDDKAKAILKLTNEADIYNALSIAGKAFKTKAFFLNMVNYDLVTDVTIDRHAIAVCIQNPSNCSALEDKYGQLTKAQYDFFQKCYVVAANKLGILPQQLQAITWTVYRRLRELQDHKTVNQWKAFDVDTENF